jgi:hypothetical protein
MGNTPSSDKASKLAGDREFVKGGLGKKKGPADRERPSPGGKKMSDKPTKDGFDPASRGR